MLTRSWEKVSFHETSLPSVGAHLTFHILGDGGDGVCESGVDVPKRLNQASTACFKRGLDDSVGKEWIAKAMRGDLKEEVPILQRLCQKSIQRDGRFRPQRHSKSF